MFLQHYEYLVGEKYQGDELPRKIRNAHFRVLSSYKGYGAAQQSNGGIESAQESRQEDHDDVNQDAGASSEAGQEEGARKLGYGHGMSSDKTLQPASVQDVLRVLWDWADMRKDQLAAAPAGEELLFIYILDR